MKFKWFGEGKNFAVAIVASLMYTVFLSIASSTFSFAVSIIFFMQSLILITLATFIVELVSHYLKLRKEKHG